VRNMAKRALHIYRDLYAKYDGKYGDLVQAVAAFVVCHRREPEFRIEVLK